MNKIIDFFRNLAAIFPIHICASSGQNSTYSVYVRRRITKNKFNIVKVYYESHINEIMYSEFVEEADTLDEAIKKAKKICKEYNGAL